jgi:hypothetical protein
MIDAAGERSEQGRFRSNRPDSSNAGLGGRVRRTEPVHLFPGVGGRQAARFQKPFDPRAVSDISGKQSSK